MSGLPELDLHAHVDVEIASSELLALNSVVFAVTRSLDEAESALQRRDPMTVWGVGCHPGLVGAQRAFSVERFSELLDHTPFVGEVGLDAKSRVPMATQVQTLRRVLETLKTKPRIASLHSYSATAALLELLAEIGVGGTVLHWWLGTVAETARAVDLGCYFSVNAAMLKRDDLLRAIPLDRLLLETDHPFGDRRSQPPRRPGGLNDVETSIGDLYGLAPEEIRLQVWRNLRGLVQDTRVGKRMPETLRRHLAAI
jgi:TatD DNase family protein